ncbi:ParB/RepB/Spo0J family partition protein [Halorussus marinus]|uniref:ParB/RepB/Spo0J family partition protein n=1 Tax=Halorussus marinus TaxID=2505976 RepID=UPI00106EDC9A|nr:ParB/RepB/Spo0J family partition protein [Halorussus marinus]
MEQASKSEDGSGYKHHDFQVEQVNPQDVVIDEVNERTTNTGPRTAKGDLEKSIAENGIENPPQVRPKEDGDGYKVFAGQRRVQAAQAVGLDEIPVIVKDLNDTEALAASVNENNEHLKKDVPRKDRAKAVKKLEEDWERERIAEYFGVGPQTVRNYLEPTRNFWEDTIFDPEVETEIDTEYIADDVLADLRRVMGKGHLAERAAKIIIKNQMPKKVVRSAINSTDNPKDFVQELKSQWEAVSSGKEQIRPRITLTGTNAERLQAWAKERGINKEQATKQLVIKKLNEIYNETTSS